VAEVEVVEVSPRDGLQAESVLLTTEAKIELIRRLTDAGISRFEVGSFVNPKLVPAMADSAAVFEGTRNLNISQIALALNKRGVTDAIASRANEIRYVVPVTDTFASRNQATTVFQAINMWNEIAPQVNSAGIRSTVVFAVAFGCPFEGNVTIGRVIECIEQLAELPNCIVLADTIGVATPGQVRSYFEAVSKLVGLNNELGAHFHDTRGTALANVMAAINAGVKQFDASVGGAGGCPFAPGSAGNLATEDLVYMLERESLVGGINLDALIETGLWLENQLHRDLAGRVHRAGGFPKQTAGGRKVAS
jgi:hydroxymethylglutaryl-CoA lyase